MEARKITLRVHYHTKEVRPENNWKDYTLWMTDNEIKSVANILARTYEKNGYPFVTIEIVNGGVIFDNC